jgi:hypothetical protein
MVEKRVLMRGMAREYSRWPKILPASPLAVALTLACLVLHGQQKSEKKRKEKQKRKGVNP